MNYEVRDVMMFAQQKGLPCNEEDIHILLTRISIELGEAQDAYIKEDKEALKKELMDVLIQTFQALGVMKTDVDHLFKETMDINYTRDFTRHKKVNK